MIQKTPEFKLAEQLIQETNRHVFLTGKAGTGKTTFLKYIKECSSKRMVVVAPTGVAAINAGGMTIHSFFQINFGPYQPGQKAAEIQKIRKEKIGIIRTLDLLVIDEISMVRADLLDAVDDVLRRIRRNQQPFGGVQLLMIGDTQQLTPVVRDDEWPILASYYDTPYFFSSTALRKTRYACVELKTIFRQEDLHFIQLLNKVRENKADQQTIQELNKRYIPDFNSKDDEGYIRLSTHNFSVQRINDEKLKLLKGKEFTFSAQTVGNFPENNYPTDPELKLKVGAQVMFIKNDSSPEKKFYNGKIGWVKSIDEGSIIVTDHKSADIAVSQEVWENIRYVINNDTKEIETHVDGTFSQYPLKTAWAITIHKSQGLTFEKAIIDAKDSFSHGQVYVALSRCKTFEGMVLSSPLSISSIKHDMRVEQFNQQAEELVPNKEELDLYKNEYILQLMDDLFSFQNIATDINIYHRLLIEHLYKSYPKLIEKLDETLRIIDEQIISVAQKFMLQLQKLIVDDSSLLNERIQKGVAYFLEKSENILLPIYKECGGVLSDNQEILKRLADVYSHFKTDINTKIATLKACQTGFSSEKFFAAKNNALITDAMSSKNITSETIKKTSTEADDIQHKELFERLRSWRKEKAEEQKMPVYVILSQTALINISNYLPTTDNELLRISGIGQKTAEKYGREIVSIVEECISQYDYKKIISNENEPKRRRRKK